MAGECQTIIVPDLQENPCPLGQMSTNCIIHQLAITYLNLPANSTLTAVLAAYLLSLKDARDTITLMQAQLADHEARITALEP